ncbi:MAG: DMT family transporter [Rickettsiales bacterium]|nr:DMT family transporter [Rickettsiales bacterium]
MTKKLSSAIFWSILSSFFVALMLCVLRYLSADYNSVILVFWRNFFALFIVLPFLLRGGLNCFKTTRLKLFWLRAIIGVIAMIIWFEAISMTSLPKATALSFTSPIFTIIVAIFFLKEKLTLLRILSVIIGFIGVLIIIRPGFASFGLGSYMVLFSTLLWSFAAIIIKKLSETESALLIVFYMNLMMLILVAPLLYIYWQDIKTSDLKWLFLLGLTSNMSHYALAKALSLADISVIMPFDFIRLIFVSIFSYILFNDVTTIYDVIGSLVILTIVFYTAFNESKFVKKNIINVRGYRRFFGS